MRESVGGACSVCAGDCAMVRACLESQGARAYRCSLWSWRGHLSAMHDTMPWKREARGEYCLLPLCRGGRVVFCGRKARGS